MRKIDFGFISKHEGGQLLNGYVPAATASMSGVTIATGFDLGAREAKDLTALKLDDDLVHLLTPYLGLKGPDAKAYLTKNPLKITKPQAESIDEPTRKRVANDLVARYDPAAKAAGAHLKFDDLIPEAQTVIASVAFQYGDLAKKAPAFWQIVTKQDFRAAVAELRSFKDRYRGRRNTEASLLDRALKKSNEAQQRVPSPALSAALTASIQGKSASGDRCFPFPTLTKSSWETGSRAFGSNRDGGARAHAGCDLYYPVQTIILAVADGKVIRGPYPFYCETFALEIDHGGFIVRYGEIGSALVKEGETVKVGQKIAKVGHLVGVSVPSDMLHLEMYIGSLKGPLTTSGPGGAKRKDGVPYKRRGDLIDPTPFLNAWKQTLKSP